MMKNELSPRLSLRLLLTLLICEQATIVWGQCAVPASAADACVESVFGSDVAAGNACVDCANNLFQSAPPACSEASSSCAALVTCPCGSCLDSVISIGECLWDAYTDCPPLDCTSNGPPTSTISPIQCQPAVGFYSFAYDTCLDSGTTAFVVANCTDGVKEEEVFTDTCDSATPYCHKCGSHKVTCSTAPQASVACEGITGNVPTPSNDINCALLGDTVGSNEFSPGLVTGQQCGSSTSANYEIVWCENGVVSNESIVGFFPCSDVGQGADTCVQCGEYQICAPPGSSCSALGASPPRGGPRPPSNGGVSLFSSAFVGSLVTLLVLVVNLLFL